VSSKSSPTVSSNVWVGVSAENPLRALGDYVRAHGVLLPHQHIVQLFEAGVAV